MPSLADSSYTEAIPAGFQRDISAPSYEVAKLIWYGLARAVRTRYNYPQRQYELFCIQYFPDSPAWPVTEIKLAAWIAFKLDGPLSQRIKGSTASIYLSALRSYHVDRFWAAPDQVFSSPTIKRMISGSIDLYGNLKKDRLPITFDILTQVTASRPTNPRDFNLRACYLVAFAGFMRLGEITYNSTDQPGSARFTQTKVTRGSIKFSPNYDHARLILPRSKTDVKKQGVSIMLAATPDAPGTCPVRALRQLFENDPQPLNAPLFNHSGKAFTRLVVQAALRNDLQRLGINPLGYSLHSIRKGAAQHAKDSGIRDDQIQVLGRWTSECFKKYFEYSDATLYAYSSYFQTGRPLPFGIVPHNLG